MIRSRIVYKYFIIALLSLSIFILIGFKFSGFLFNYIREQEYTQRQGPLAPIFLARIVDRINPQDKVKALSELESWHGDFRGPQLMLFDENGRILYPEGSKSNLDWQAVKLPTAAYEYFEIENARDSIHPHGDNPPSPKHFFLFAPPPPPPPFDRNKSVLIRLQGEPAQFLLITSPPPGPPPGMQSTGGLGPWIPWLGFISMLVSLFLGIGTALAFIYQSVNKNVRLADEVIQELQRGNLKARFRVERDDEFGKAMQRFNTMAQEIENLVENLKQAEHARTKMLQELAHDLRTPLASLRSMLETLEAKDQELPPKTKQELYSLCNKECEYFSRLVEDLLFLSQVSEPKYHLGVATCPLSETLKEECEDMKFRAKGLNKDIACPIAFENEVHLKGNPLFLRRLFRNALENATSFSKSKVEIHTQLIQENFVIEIDDDGPGFSQQTLEHFGERRFSRQVLMQNNTSRVSVGLGFVVMKTICELHGGQLKAENRHAPNGDVLGAKVTISLPILPK